MTGNTSTPKARALGRALREARETRKMSLRTLATKLGRDASQLSRWESGYRVPKDTDVARLLAHLGVNNDQCDDILEMCDGANEPRWLAASLPEQWRHVEETLAQDRTAHSITDVSMLLIPGLLQTGAYARAMMTAARFLPSDVDTRVAVRTGRREVITQYRPVKYTSLIGEAAVNQLIGSIEIMVDQMDFIHGMAQRPNIEMRIVPFSSGWHPGLENLFSVIEAETDSTVLVEGERTNVMLHEVDDLLRYREAAGRVCELALNTSDSRDLVKEMKGIWESRLMTPS